jgi:hypothetical protein
MADDTQHALTFFAGQISTRPTVDYPELSSSRVIEFIAPDDGPRVLEAKSSAPHFLPCMLREAPYIGRTAERFAPGAIGKQRSASHVTVSSWLAADLDDITDADLTQVLRRLDGRAFVAYSTYGHGKVEGLARVRVALFLDRALEPVDWSRVWRVINEVIFDGNADTATARMHQAAAVWCSHPDRVRHSFRHVRRGAPLSADRLLDHAPKPQPVAVTAPYAASQGGRRWRYAAALLWQDAGDYSTWQSGLLSLRAAVERGEVSDAEGRDLWLAWSRTAPDERRARNTLAQYDPIAMWERKRILTTPAHVLVGALFGRAKAAAERQYKADHAAERTEAGQRAERYLREFHSAAFRQL